MHIRAHVSISNWIHSVNPVSVNYTLDIHAYVHTKVF